MTADILGPASDAFAVTTRPGDGRTFGALDTWFTDCTSASAGDGTDISAEFLNALTGNLRGHVRINGNTAAGALVVPNDNTDGMMASALLHLGQRGVYSRALDTGAAGALVIAPSPTPPELLDGMVFVVKAKAANTGPSTISVSGTVYPVVSKAGAALTGGEIVAGAWQSFRFDATRKAFQVDAAPAGTAAAATPQNALVHDGSATGGNALTTTLTPALVPPVTAGLWMAVPITAANTGAATIDFGSGTPVNGVVPPNPVPIVNNRTGVALVGGEMPGGVGFVAFLFFDGTSARLMNPQATSFSKLTVLTLSGTYTPTPGAKRVQGIAIGPGGPGGASNGSPNYVGAGGGAGEACLFDIDLVANPGPIVYAIGAPSAPSAGNAAVGSTAPAGSPTTFGPGVTAHSGLAGLNSCGSGPGALGGSGGTGLLVLPGNPGDGVVGNQYGAGAGMRGGNGGASILGGGGLGVDGNIVNTNNPTPGGAGLAFGAGGGGADSAAGSAVPGGAGFQGGILYREIF